VAHDAGCIEYLHTRPRNHGGGIGHSACLPAVRRMDANAGRDGLGTVAAIGADVA
jgi:hypothetical protein